MYTFENYTLIIYETPETYYSDYPQHRFNAYLKEIPEASLHEYGATQEEAIRNLYKQFEFFQKDNSSKGIEIPPPTDRDIKNFSGKIVLRMPPWLHAKIADLAEEQKISINSYIVNRLINTSTVEESARMFDLEQKQFMKVWEWHNLFMKSEEVTIGIRTYPTPPPNNVYHFKSQKVACNG